MTEPKDGASMAGFRHHQIATCGISMHVVEAGSGPLMVLVSGWPQTWYSWHKIMPELARHFRVVAVDLPGLGDSDYPKDGYDTGSISLHLDGVLDAFDARDCILVTHDVGAWVGYAYAARRPERVKRLVLMDAAIPGMASPEVFRLSPETARKVWHFYFNFIPDLPELLVVGREQEFLTWLFRTKSADWSTAFDPAALDIYVKAYAAPGRWSGGMGYYRSIFDSIEQNRVTASTPLTMPVLAIGGASSLGESMATSIGQLAENVQGAVIDGCGHYVPEERPGELLAVLLPFSLA
ncbi:MAG: alpha/beta hydrolase [Tardiphaga sp.]|nr:alpha/beta hydrolase [Tardiphaga sp.]